MTMISDARKRQEAAAIPSDPEPLPERDRTDRELLALVLVKLDQLQADVDAFKLLADTFAELGSKGLPGILGAMLGKS